MSKQPYKKTLGLKPPENYERFFVPAIGTPVAEDLIRHTALNAGERVLDVACGTGIVARLASEQVGLEGSATGLDINPGMLAVARSVTSKDMPIEWYEANAEDMPLPDGTFDVVLCQMGLQFMENKTSALQEMRRVLAPGGRLILNVPGPAGKIFIDFAEAMERNISPEAAGFLTQVFSLYKTDEIQQLMSKAGFNEIAVQANNKTLRLPLSKEFMWQYIKSTPLAEIVLNAGDEARTALECEVVKKWQNFENDDTLKYQQRIVTASARK
jgi:ubiquinone/menaquinone biosynthesis C-methylase UbiE